MKTCSKCNLEKNETEFYIKDGSYVSAQCKQCEKIRRSKYYFDNKEKTILVVKEWAQRNKDKIRAASSKWKKNNRLKVNNYIKNKRSIDPHYQMRTKISSTLNYSLNHRKNEYFIKDIGCTVGELKIWLEAKFQPGMTWENWSLDGWHIDHKKDLKTFDLTNREQFLKASHYTNLQPLWAFENLQKRGNE